MIRSLSTRLKQQDGNLSQVEIDEMLRLVCHVATEVSADDAMPGWVVFFVKLLFDISSNVFFNVVFLQGLCRTINGVLLHLLGHVGIFDHSFSVRHGCCKQKRSDVTVNL